MPPVLAILSIPGGNPGAIEFCEGLGRLHFVACHLLIPAIAWPKWFLARLAGSSIARGCERVGRLHLSLACVLDQKQILFYLKYNHKFVYFLFTILSFLFPSLLSFSILSFLF